MDLPNSRLSITAPPKVCGDFGEGAHANGANLVNVDDVLQLGVGGWSTCRP